MEEYKESYCALFSAVSKAIAEIEQCNYGTAKTLLVQGQQTAEELFIQQDEEIKKR